MKHNILLFVIGLFLFGCQVKSKPTINSSSNFSPVQVNKNQFVIDGQPKVFRGLCLEDLGELHSIGHWGEEYIKQASLWKADIVRFPVHPKYIHEMGKETYLKELKKGIDWAKKHGMYSIIDWHVIGNMKSEQWQHSMYETTMNETLDFWTTIAKQYKDEPAVAFYEIYNEPTCFKGKLGHLNWDELMSIQKTILDSIRSYDANKVALVSGLNWAYDNSGLKQNDPEFANVAYVAHPYPQKDDEPWAEAWNEHFGFITAKYPVFATEFGFSLDGQKGAHIPVISDEHYGEAVLDYFKSKDISHTAWCFSWHWYPTLLKDSTYTPNKGQGEFFYKKFIEKHES